MNTKQDYETRKHQRTLEAAQFEQERQQRRRAQIEADAKLFIATFEEFIRAIVHEAGPAGSDDIGLAHMRELIEARANLFALLTSKS